MCFPCIYIISFNSKVPDQPVIITKVVSSSFDYEDGISATYKGFYLIEQIESVTRHNEDQFCLLFLIL